MLEVRLFGHAGVTAAGQPVKFAKRATTLAILARVVLLRGAAISRESLAFTLFPEAEESAALAELRRYLYLLTKALPEREGDPWILADSETIRWNDGAGAFVDVLAFERDAASEETHARAIDVYAGDLLEEIYDDWVVAERERLRSRYLAVLTESLDRSRSRREFVAAIACAKRLLATDPWREDALRALLAARYESGDTAGALAEYEAFAKRLRDELAVAPMPETVAVRQSILRSEAIPGSLDRRPLVERTRRHAATVLPFVGREHELALLQGLWTRAARGNATLAVLTGEAGAGKTRLTAELARIAATEGGRVYAGSTSASESTPYQAILEALRSGLPVIATRPPDAARRRVLARVLPELSDSGDPAEVLPEANAERESARLYDAFAHAVRALATPRPLLLVLEDVHWAGAATLDALGAIVRALARTPMLVVATAREEETPADHPLRGLVRTLRPGSNVEEIALERLGESDVADLVTRVEGLDDEKGTLARDLFEHSEGNALFLNEAISGALERGEPVEATLATSIAAVIDGRIARLGDEAGTVAEIAAVVGAGCSVRVVREVANLPAAAIARGFDELLDRRIVREAGARSHVDYVFTHHLLAQAMYDRIEPVFRAQRHARIARVLETEFGERGGASAREIARQYELAGNAVSSSAWYLKAARQAASFHAYGDAIDLATNALRDAATDEARREALDLRERARGRRGDRAGQGVDIAELELLTHGDLERRFDVLARRVLLARTLGDSDEEGRRIAEMEALAPSLGEVSKARALVERATHEGFLSRKAEGIAPARAALAIYERLGDVNGQLECLGQLVDFATNVGDLEASRSYLAQMSERAATVADRAVEARAIAVAATEALLHQRYREAFDLSTRGLAINIETNDLEGEAASRGRRAVTAAWFPDFALALREFDRALEAYEAIGHKRGLAITHTNRTLLSMRLGLFDDALASIESANAYFSVVHERRTIVANASNASFVMLQRGDASRAKELAEDALAGAREMGFPVFEAAVLANLGNAERALGSYDVALEHMEAGLAIRRTIQEPSHFVDDLADLTIAYASAGRPSDALATARELESLGTGGFEGAFWPHYIRWAISEGLRAGGEAASADAAASHAREEARAFAERIDDARARDAFLAAPITNRILTSGDAVR